MPDDPLRAFDIVAAERLRNRAGNGTADRAAGQHLHQHQRRKNERNGRQRRGAELTDVPGLDHADACLHEEAKRVRGGHAKQHRQDRAFDHLLGASGYRAAEDRSHRRRRCERLQTLHGTLHQLILCRSCAILRTLAIAWLKVESPPPALAADSAAIAVRSSVRSSEEECARASSAVGWTRNHAA